jgi:ABC-type multidrug transport system ATPase subunit
LEQWKSEESLEAKGRRVNVGLEMVMEPSLLILDEPTSGLDSASSLHLLRALRREALEGVNICMVVHQPR